GFRFRERGGHAKSLKLTGVVGRRDTRPIEGAWQREKPVKMMNFRDYGALSGHVDIVPARPYLCPHRVDGDGVYFARVFAVEPWIARFPLNWRMTPRHRNGTATRHGELMGNPDHIRTTLRDRRNRTLA